MKTKIKLNQNNKMIALFEIAVLIIATFAFCWMIGGEVEVVSAKACTPNGDELAYAKNTGPVTNGGCGPGDALCIDGICQNCAILGGQCGDINTGTCTKNDILYSKWGKYDAGGGFIKGVCSGGENNQCCLGTYVANEKEEGETNSCDGKNEGDKCDMADGTLGICKNGECVAQTGEKNVDNTQGVNTGGNNAANNIADNADRTNQNAFQKGSTYAGGILTLDQATTAIQKRAQGGNKAVEEYLKSKGYSDEKIKEIMGSDLFKTGRIGFLQQMAKSFTGGELPIDKLISNAEVKLTDLQNAYKKIEVTNKEALTKAQAEIDKAKKELDILHSKKGIKGYRISSGAYILETYLVAIGTAKLYVQVAKWLGAGTRNLNDLKDASWWIGGSTATLAVVGSYTSLWGSLPGWMTTTFGASAMVGPVGWIVALAVVAAMAIYTLTSYKQYYQEIFVYSVNAWKAKDGGNECDKCNDLKYGCSEYQCKTFGKACELINKGTKQETCIWKNQQDQNAPIIIPLNKTLGKDYSYEPIKLTSPPTTGVKLKYIGKGKDAKGCLVPYSSVTLGVETDEAAECKIDVKRTESFDVMTAPMGEGSILTKEHTIFIPSAATASVEGLNASGALTISNGQEQEFFIRCKDANGNIGEMEFLMEFCVQEGPDMQAPIIQGTNFLNTSYLEFNQTSAYLEVYTNEPAECKWDFENFAYDKMNYGMDWCSNADGSYLYQNMFQYGCNGKVIGLKNYIDNKIYIKCIDKPWWKDGMSGKQYFNDEPYLLTLKGTQPVLINKIFVNDKENGTIIKDSTDPVKIELKVETSAGADNGNARCQYGIGNAYNYFYNEGSFDFINPNIQNLYLGAGTYNIGIKCEDIGGNLANSSITFTIDVDKSAPVISRMFYDAGTVRVVSDEEMECVYNTNSAIGCLYNFEDGLLMDKVSESSYSTAWESNKQYFIKCKDKFENRPLPGECSVIVRAFGQSNL